MRSTVERDYVKSVIKGLTIGHLCLGVAACVGIVTVAVVGWTQLNFLVSWVPVILATLFLMVTILLLQKDMAAQENPRHPKEH